jgi:hypothetical protein
MSEQALLYIEQLSAKTPRGASTPPSKGILLEPKESVFTKQAEKI